jgi:hypothetical protein
MFESYYPKKFCREYVELKGASSQLVMFMSLVLGIKPLMDDWIEKNKLNAFQEICKQYGIHVKTEAQLLQYDKSGLREDIIGKDLLTSTSAFGLPLEAPVNGSVHIFMSKKPELLQHGMWYPMIIKNRIFWPPLVDIWRYGYLLGYPDCCIKFFRKYNNWAQYSFLYEIYKNTPAGKAHYFCNPLGKDMTYSYIYHMPCSYNCTATIALVTELRSEIARHEPDFVKLIDRHLKLPWLVFYERKFYAFEGKLSGSKLKYSKVYFPDSDTSKNYYQGILQAGDTVEIKDRDLMISNRGKLLQKITLPLTKFAPEYPYMIQFS